MSQHIVPSQQQAAGHIPAELYAVVEQMAAQRGMPTAQPVVIVQQQQSRPIGRYVAGAAGAGILAVSLLLAIAVVAVAVAVGAVSCAVGWVALKSMTGKGK